MTAYHLILSFFSREFLTWPPVIPPTVMIKLKGCHFDTTEVIEAESQMVLNTLTEQGFQDAFKN
jgi:hypothetical protein